MTEEEITHKHAQAVLKLGQDFYRWVLPVVEIVEDIKAVLELNREMYKLKNHKKEDVSEGAQK